MSEWWFTNIEPKKRKEISSKKILSLIPYEYPPKPEESLEETLKWVQAILHLIMARVVSTLTPPPFFLGQNLSEKEIEEWWRSQKFEKQFKKLYEQLVETALDICKATITNKEKLLTINETMKLTYFSLLEEALKLYGLNFEKVAEKIRRGETPKITRPIKAYFSALKPQNHEASNK
ncbi:MAG: hypothetical protein QXZ68_07830 [Candidatus Bathyarchaeia archaeon]